MNESTVDHEDELADDELLDSDYTDSGSEGSVIDAVYDIQDKNTPPVFEGNRLEELSVSSSSDGSPRDSDEEAEDDPSILFQLNPPSPWLMIPDEDPLDSQYQIAAFLIQHFKRFEVCSIEHHRDLANGREEGEEEEENVTTLSNMSRQWSSFADSINYSTATDNTNKITQVEERTIPLSTFEFIYSGIDRIGNPKPKRVDIYTDIVPDINVLPFKTTFDIDSITGFPTSIELFKEGFAFYPYLSSARNISSNIYFDRQLIIDDKLVSVRLDKIPHILLGQYPSFQGLDLFLFFPHCYYNDRPINIMRDRDLELFYNKVWLRAIRRVVPAHITQHFRFGDFASAKLRASAQSKETVNSAAN